MLPRLECVAEGSGDQREDQRDQREGSRAVEYGLTFGHQVHFLCQAVP